MKQRLDADYIKAIERITIIRMLRDNPEMKKATTQMRLDSERNINKKI